MNENAIVFPHNTHELGSGHDAIVHNLRLVVHPYDIGLILGGYKKCTATRFPHVDLRKAIL